jgi:phosphate transport system substrate-binding protein
MNRFLAAVPKLIAWHKKVGRVLAPAVFAAGIAIGVGLYVGVDGFYIKVTAASPAPAQLTPSTAQPQLSSKPVCAAGSLQLIGSTAFGPIAQAAADAYLKDCPGAVISIIGGGGAYGLTRVQDAVASRSPSADSIIAMYDGVPSDTAGLTPYPMGLLIFSIVAHTGLFSGNITISELHEIFVKPGKQGLVAVGLPAGDGSRQAFITNVLDLNPGAPANSNCPVPTGSKVSFTSCTEDSAAGLLYFVNGTPNAIGYGEVFGTPVDYPHVSVLSIDGAAPTAANVHNDSYRFWAVENLYTTLQPTALTKDFLDFLPYYLESNASADFVACTEAPRLLGAGC